MAMAPTLGKAVKCENDVNSASVYRFLGDEIRGYPSRDIATSWDPLWGNFVTIPCGGLRKGSSMTARTIDGTETKKLRCHRY